MTDYFLSYSRADQTKALRFANDLRAAGLGVWVDQYDIPVSAHWDREVHAALLRAFGIIVVLSPKSAESPNVADEISVAINSGKHVIPILIEPCNVPLRLTRVQYIDATGDYDEALRRVVIAIEAQGGETVKAEANLQSPEPAPARATLAAIDLDAAEKRLAPHVGPIAKLLVQKAAAKAGSLEALHADLATAIPDKTARAAFLEASTPSAASTAPEPRHAAIAAETIDALAKALAPYLGPIASIMVKREAAVSASADDLCATLAAQIPSQTDRNKFLAAAVKAGVIEAN